MHGFGAGVGVGPAGTGSGKLMFELDGGTAERYGADLSMTLAAAEVWGDIVTLAQGASAFAPAIKADAVTLGVRYDA